MDFVFISYKNKNKKVLGKGKACLFSSTQSMEKRKKEN